METQIKAQYEAMAVIMSEFEKNLKNKVVMEKDLDNLRYSTKPFENRIKTIVAEAVDDETGKKKYTNIEARNLAEDNMLRHDKEYQKIVSDIDKAEYKLKLKKTEIEILERRMRVMSKQSDLLVALTNFKAKMGEVNVTDRK